jgi:hypothetical protein
MAGAVEELFGKKGTDTAAENRRALAEACRWTVSANASFELPGSPPHRPSSRPPQTLSNSLRTPAARPT